MPTALGHRHFSYKFVIKEDGMYMEDQFSRTRLLLGDEKMRRLYSAKVAVFGIGGVGTYVVEALARSGVGSFVLVDKDNVSITNINRQLIATMETLGRSKVEVMGERISAINPKAEIELRQSFFLPENADDFDFSAYSYVVDAVDTVTAKLELIKRAKHFNVPVISSMGAGNKLSPAGFRVADIYETKVCPLARVMRRELKKMGIESLKVVYSEEEPLRPAFQEVPQIPGSIAFVPSAAGLILAGEVVRDLAGL